MSSIAEYFDDADMLVYDDTEFILGKLSSNNDTRGLKIRLAKALAGL